MKHFSIIVTFKPNIHHLLSLCNSLIHQESTVVIVDNSNIDFFSDIVIEDCILFLNGQNLGVAAAQNIGILYAMKNGADVLSFFDQDSEVDNCLLEKLVLPIKLELSNITAPVPINKHTGKEYPSQMINRIGWPENIYSYGFDRPYKVDLVISSGITISKKIFQNIGLFDVDFFIDFVDIEWCLRCKKNRIPIFIIPTAKMNHSIGDKDIKIGRLVCSLHSPQRTYYKVRNSFLIMRKGFPFLFTFRQLSSALIKNLLVICKINNCKEYLKYYFLGIRDGIFGKVGKGIKS